VVPAGAAVTERSATRRPGDAAARHRVAVLLVWVALVVGLGVAAAWSVSTAEPGTRWPAVTPTTAARTALDRVSAQIPGAGDPAGWIVVLAPDATTVDSAKFSPALDALVAGLQNVPGVTAVVDPATGGTVSADRRIAVIPVAVAADLPRPGDTRSAVETLAAVTRADDLTVELGGVLAAPDPGPGWSAVVALAVGVLVAAAIAWLMLGSVVCAMLVMTTALVGSGVGTAAAVLAGRSLGLGASGAVLVFVLGLAVGGPAAVLMFGCGARPTVTVVRGCLLLVIATAGLAVSGVGVLTVVGAAGALVTVTSTLAALTLLPALRAMAGERIRPRSISGAPGRWGRWVGDHPLPTLCAAVVMLAAVTVPAAIWAGDGSGRPVGRAEELLAAAFGPGAAGPLLLVVQVDRPEAMATALPDVARAAQAVDGVALAAPGRVAADGTLGIVTVLPNTGPADPATRDLVHRLRDRSLAPAGVNVEVTGSTAAAIEVADELAGAIGRYLLLVGVAELALLVLLLRPWLFGVASAVGSVLSVGATVLLTRAVGGRVGWPTGWGWVPGVDAMVPVVALALVSGLVLAQAVRSAVGWPDGFRPITVCGCAAMVAALFGAVLPAAGAVTAGVALAVLIGVLLDVLVVRLTLLPAVLALLAGPRRSPVDTVVVAAEEPAGAHAADGMHSAEPDRRGRGVIEQALGAPESRGGGRHRGG